MESTLSGYGTLDRMGIIEARLLQAMAELEANASEREARILQTMAELEAKAAEREAQQARHINQAVGILLAGLALAVGIILGFG